MFNLTISLKYIFLLLTYCVIVIQPFIASDAEAVLRKPLSFDEQRSLPQPDQARLLWLKQIRINVMSDSNENFQDNIKTIDTWHGCLKTAIDILSLSYDLKSGAGNIQKAIDRHKAAITLLKSTNADWMKKLLASTIKDVNDLRNITFGFNALFFVGLAVDIIATKTSECFGLDNTMLTNFLNENDQQKTAEVIKKIVDSPFGATLFGIMLDVLKGLDIATETAGYGGYTLNPRQAVAFCLTAA